MPSIAIKEWQIGPCFLSFAPQIPRPPAKEKWAVSDAVLFMASGATWEQSHRVAVICDTPEINGTTLEATARMDRLPLSVYKARDLNIDGFRKRFRSFRFIVTQSDWHPPNIQTSNPLLPHDIDLFISDYFHKHQDDFNLASSTELPNGNYILIYERKILQETDTIP